MWTCTATRTTIAFAANESRPRPLTGFRSEVEIGASNCQAFDLVGPCELLLAVGACALLTNRYGSFAAVCAAVRGESFSIIPGSVNVGDSTTGEYRPVAFEVVNLSGAVPLRVLGVQEFCGKSGCVTVNTELPIEIPALSSKTTFHQWTAMSANAWSVYANGHPLPGRRRRFSGDFSDHGTDGRGAQL